MKLLVCFLLIFLGSSIIAGQKTFDVHDFSDDYYGKVFLERPAEVFSKGWIGIYHKNTNEQLIKIDSEELVSSFEGGKVKVNVKQLPYGEQSLIIFEDMNFDGVKDFALMDGQNSCYHGPSFKIFTGSNDKTQFRLDRELTRLAQEYCGMFQIDRSERKLLTMTKSGCCWHEYSEFAIVNTKPKAVKIVEEDATRFPFLISSIQTWDGRYMAKSSKRSVELKGTDASVILSFSTENGSKEVIIFSLGDELNYVFVNENENIEFAYPLDAAEEPDNFLLDSKTNPSLLSFFNKGVSYRVYEKENGKIGVQVEIGSTITNIIGDFSSTKGSLRNLVGLKFSNLTVIK